jgi:hypothetical protein
MVLLMRVKRAVVSVQYKTPFLRHKKRFSRPEVITPPIKTVTSFAGRYDTQQHSDFPFDPTALPAEKLRFAARFC